ncbi:hypothetical protein CAEBREN_08824 [Caenorhabditis brenneri]|uniref:Uncharacterized protein n=1 Tax=Caenorhabditis brenneri TaxID=135651 RepID=G0MT41_CAEBE|nr:hypothetical protein CAEBREN_08824 [Caenorhabditis brenneri]
MPRFSGKTVIITGSSNGIGRSAALLFAQDGANVTITGRNAERLEETRQLLLKSGIPEKNINSVVADVTTPEGQEQLIKTTLDKFGKIDILVNNAGAAISDNTGVTGTDQSIEVYHKTLQLNLQAVIQMTQKAKASFGGCQRRNRECFYNFMASHKECIPAGFSGRPEDIANIILFLADRNLSSYIIGQSIVADGGSTLVMGGQAHDLKAMLGM